MSLHNVVHLARYSVVRNHWLLTTEIVGDRMCLMVLGRIQLYFSESGFMILYNAETDMSIRTARVPALLAGYLYHSD